MTHCIGMVATLACWSGSTSACTWLPTPNGVDRARSVTVRVTTKGGWTCATVPSRSQLRWVVGGATGAVERAVFQRGDGCNHRAAMAEADALLMERVNDEAWGQAYVRWRDLVHVSLACYRAAVRTMHSSRCGTTKGSDVCHFKDTWQPSRPRPEKAPTTFGGSRPKRASPTGSASKPV